MEEQQHIGDSQAQAGGEETHGGHEEHAAHGGGCNHKSPGPSTLPPVSPWALALFGITLALLLAALVASSLNLAQARQNPVVTQPHH